MKEEENKISDEENSDNEKEMTFEELLAHEKQIEENQ